MRSNKIRGSLVLVIILFISVFQNCARTSFKSIEAVGQAIVLSAEAAPQIPLSIVCESEKKKEGEAWMSAIDQERETVPCKIGTGNQIQVYDVSKELKCINGMATPTGIADRQARALEGICNLDCGTHKNDELWLVEAGQSREVAVCRVGTGSQFQVYNLFNEMKCTNGITSVTEKIEKQLAGLEGKCNLDCGAHVNGQLWWTELPISSEDVQCPTSATAVSKIRYQNLAEYSCKNAVAEPTGNLQKEKIDESACPPMTFNDQDNQATLAFEDIYPTPLDSDYNDFVTNIKVVETYNSIGELTKIVLEYAAKHIGGGLPHKLITIFDGTVRGRDGWVSNQNFYKSQPMFNGNATIQYELLTPGKPATLAIVPKDVDLVVFESTSKAVNEGMVAKITITGIDGKQNLLTDRKGVNIKRYRSLLYIPDSQTYSSVKRYDIDISDINPNAYDNVGRPLGFFVPTNWKTVKEGTNIELAYPDFQSHADFLKSLAQNSNLVEPDKSKNWFNNVILGYVDN